MLRLLIVFTLLPLSPAVGAEISFDEINIRLGRAFQIAREANDQKKIERLFLYRDQLKGAWERQDTIAIPRLLVEMEELVDVENNGRAMYGLPVAMISRAMKEKSVPLNAKLTEAMNANQPDVVADQIRKMKELLGDQAGLPDVRIKGHLELPRLIPQRDIVDLFMALLDENPRSRQLISSGKPILGYMPRAYASVVRGCIMIRPLVQKYHPDKLAQLDALITGACQSMLALQSPTGFFHFPDLRGQSIRFGDMITKLLLTDPDAVKDGWVVVEDPEGGSQFDAGECGMSLLLAGQTFKKDEWLAAGIKAADWCLKAPMVANFNYNSFSVSLLCAAYQHTKKQEYLTAATTKYHIGVVSGQLSNGRWIDPHNARAVYMTIMVRSQHDLAECLPDGKDREMVISQAASTIASLLDEAEKLGPPISGNTLQELIRHARLNKKADKRLPEAIKRTLNGGYLRCNPGKKVRSATPLPELSAAALYTEGVESKQK
ncbi:MAG: hypothetical protein R3B84_17060 [Zavarzinella sp.]